MTTIELLGLTSLVVATILLSRWLAAAAGISLWLSAPLSIAIVVCGCWILSFAIERVARTIWRRGQALDKAGNKAERENDDQARL